LPATVDVEDTGNFEQEIAELLDDTEGLDEKDKKKYKEMQSKVKAGHTKKLSVMLKGQLKASKDVAAKTYKQALGSAENAFKGAL